jgi:hypothetical protein
LKGRDDLHRELSLFETDLTKLGHPSQLLNLEFCKDRVGSVVGSAHAGCERTLFRPVKQVAAP